MYTSQIYRFDGKTILAYGKGNLICSGRLTVLPNENGEDFVLIRSNHTDIRMPISSLYYVIERPLGEQA